MSQKQRQERQARYSLYSTDSEDQVASAHRGLDRCAALLKSLLSPEKGSQAPPQHQAPTVRREPAHGSHKISNAATTTGKTKDSRAPKTAKPQFPGAPRLLPPPPSSLAKPAATHTPSMSSAPAAGHPPPPPSSSSKPAARHPPQPLSSSPVPAAKNSRTKTDTKATGKPPGTVGKSPREAPSKSANQVNMVTQSRFTEPGKPKSSRRLLVAHRRLKTEPGKKTTSSRVSATTGGDVRSDQPTNKNTFTSLGNRNRTQTANVIFRTTQQPQLQTNESRSAPRGLPANDPNPRGTTSVPHAPSQAPPPSLGYQYPCAVPPLHFASPYGYYPPFWPYFDPSARFAPPIASQGPTLFQTLQPGLTHPTHPLASLHSASLPHLPAQSHTASSHNLNSSSHQNISCRNPEENAVVQNQDRVEHSNKSTPYLGTVIRDCDPNTPAGPSHVSSTAKGASEPPTATVTVATHSATSRCGPWQGPIKNREGLQSDDDPGVLHSWAAEAIQVLAQEMLSSVKDSIVRIRGVARPTNAELLKSLQDLEDSQKRYHERLTALCLGQIQDFRGGRIHESLDPATNMADRSSLPSTADWLAQLQQLESEKSHLLERVVQSEMAYSETKGLLDQAEKKAEQLRKELEGQLLSVKGRLQNTSEALSTLKGEKTAVEEELERVRTVEAQLTRQLNSKTVALEMQVSSLEEQLSESRGELCRSGDQLSATRCALETGREEKQMVQLSLAEKETELLQAQDRLLGLRQCLAYFLSDVVKSDTPHRYQQHSPLALLHYCVPREAVQRLQSLVSEGNVERFLAAYDSCPRQSGGGLLATLRASPTPVDTSSPRLSRSPLGSSLQLSPAPPTPVNTSSPRLSRSPLGSSLQQSPAYSSPNPKGKASPVQLCASGDDSRKCAHVDSDDSTIVAQGDASTDSTGKVVVKPGSISSSRKGFPCQLRTAHEEVPLSQQSGIEVEHTVLHTAASHRVNQAPALRNSSPKSTVSSWSGVGATNLTSTDLQSVLTTSSEVEFRRDLASLDADIARLQMQFRVAMQRQPKHHL